MKICPRCGKGFEGKRRNFCSRSCANVRVHTEEDKEVRRQKLLEYHQTPEGAATREKLARFNRALNTGQEFEEVNVEDFAVEIPSIQDIHDYDDFLVGYNNAENW